MALGSKGTDDAIVDAVEQWQTELAALDPPTTKIGAWNCGRCPRQLWHIIHKPDDGEPLVGRTLRLFESGNKHEELVVQALTQAGVQIVRTNDPAWNMPLPPLTSRVRPDLLAYRSVNHPDGPGWEPVETIKALSNYRFRELERKRIDFEVVAQAHCYMRALGTDVARVIGVRKETLHLCEVRILWDTAVWDAVERNVNLALGDPAPPRPAPFDKGVGAPLENWPCGYCAFKHPCFDDVGAIETTVHRGRPQHMLVAHPPPNPVGDAE